MSVQPISAEKYAEQLLRKAWDGAYSPDLRGIADATALTVREVEAIRDRLLAGRRERLGPVAPVRVTPPPAPTTEPEPWRRAVDHPNARIRRAAAKAVDAVAAVEALLADDAGKAQLRQREAKLLAELNKVRAELRGAAADPAAAGKVPCPECGDPVHPHRLPQHRARSAKHS